MSAGSDFNKGKKGRRAPIKGPGMGRENEGGEVHAVAVFQRGGVCTEKKVDRRLLESKRLKTRAHRKKRKSVEERENQARKKE